MAALRVTRLGLVFTAEMGPDWMHSHAAYPAPVQLGSDRLRVFMVARDTNNRGLVGYVDVDPADPCRILSVSQTPSLRPGPLGSFSDRGLSIGCVLRKERALWLYYMGWNKSADVPFRNAIGLAIDQSGTGERFEHAFEGPLVDRSRFDPFTLSYPFVEMPSKPAETWRMIYGTSRGGGVNEDEMHHVLTDAVSADGIDWRPSGEIRIGLEASEYGLSRPWISQIGDREWMFYSIRQAKYTIGASTRDPVSGKWRRVSNDLLGSGRAPFDDEATCYPAVIRSRNRLFLFYNGNGYGRTGLGVAEITE